MCLDCGCSEANAKHTHAHGKAKGPPHDHAHPHEHPHEHDHAHPHEHDHEHEHPHAEAPGGLRTVSLEQKILARNDARAAENRAWLEARGVVTINLISSPGTGKTFLLERTLERLRGRVRCAVITGDVQTDRDAQRLAGKGADVRQIETQSACHLDAERIGALLPELIQEDTRLLFIENVGNLVCPAAFDLGESFKIALLSTTEGEDKPLKYPTLFSQAPVAVLTKMDLAPHLDWDLKSCRENLRRIRPGLFIFELSAKTGEGMDAWIDYLLRLID